MLDFLWHLRGSITLAKVYLDAVTLDRVELLLKKERKEVIERGSGYLVFNAPFWGDPNDIAWFPMRIYGCCRFWIEQGIHENRLRYDLSSLRILIYWLFIASIGFWLVLTDDSLAGALKTAASAFAWFYGVSILLALLRVPPAIRKAVAGG